MGGGTSSQAGSPAQAVREAVANAYGASAADARAYVKMANETLRRCEVEAMYATVKSDRFGASQLGELREVFELVADTSIHGFPVIP